MQTRIKVLLALLILPAPVAEILCTNIPAYNFLLPQAWIISLLVYGCGALLIREAKIRWGMQWSVAFLAVAYGIFEEGLVTQAFFNPYWFDTPSYWMAFGVQWGMTLMLLVFHASISTLIPIYIIHELWPDFKDKPVTGNRGTALALLGTLAAICIGMNSFAGPKGQGAFFASSGLLIAGFAAIAILAILAYRLRTSRIRVGRGLLPPIAIAAIAFILQGTNFILSPMLSHFGFKVEAGVPIQLFFILIFAAFSATQLLNKSTERRHVTAYAFGSLLFWIVFGFMIGLNAAAGRIDLVAVMPVALLLLVAWMRRASKIKGKFT
ncbi:MAG: hypothetical protein JXC85_00365 [Candidatus Aenigmarchaeota archaeon]|nr:hypothetical protein [Candidatus Aenigmarchaeota archaeon]